MNQLSETTSFPKKIKGITAKLTINTLVKPVVVETKIQEKLNDALAKDIIENVIGPSPWISPMTAIESTPIIPYIIK